ncbi:MAG TPA: PIN domain-containing protein [Pyrinomonadaceae bacterium]|nr:PIN domain-containing protein [Pyrinomonadaceae bacterium]
MTSYLVDSGFLYGFIDKTDVHHQSVSPLLTSIKSPIYLPVPAITEVSYFVSKRLGNDVAADFLEDLSNTDLILENPTPGDFQRSAEILRKYNDQSIDFVDACIVAMAERLNITTILTVDRRHFSIFKPNHCDSFELLPD